MFFQVGTYLQFSCLSRTYLANDNLVPRAFPLKVGGAGKDSCLSRTYLANDNLVPGAFPCPGNEVVANEYMKDHIFELQRKI